MSGETSSAARSGRSWREISQEVTPRALSRKGRRRRLLEWVKLGLIGGMVAGAAGAVYVGLHAWQGDRTAIAAVAGGDAVREVSVITDGTLTRQWVEETLALPKGARLMELDLPALRDRLLASGQVRAAVVTRSFPDMLVCTLQERTPVVRVQVQTALERPEQLFVARDGVVYRGVNYDPRLVAGLPWLDGVRLVRDKHGYAPVPGLDAVADLLGTAQLQAPQVYQGWLVVSLARLESRDEIVVRSQDIPEIVFSRREDFFKQLARLDYIADMVRRFPQSGPMQSVNLALGGQVPVKLASSPEELARQAGTPQFNLPPTTQPKGPRDL